MTTTDCNAIFRAKYNRKKYFCQTVHFCAFLNRSEFSHSNKLHSNGIYNVFGTSCPGKYLQPDDVRVDETVACKLKTALFREAAGVFLATESIFVPVPARRSFPRPFWLTRENKRAFGDLRMNRRRKNKRFVRNGQQTFLVLINNAVLFSPAWMGGKRVDHRHSWEFRGNNRLIGRSARICQKLIRVFEMISFLALCKKTAVLCSSWGFSACTCATWVPKFLT